MTLFHHIRAFFVAFRLLLAQTIFHLLAPKVFCLSEFDCCMIYVYRNSAISIYKITPRGLSRLSTFTLN